ncbi:hypothetical protein [Aquiflexum gelatinilyticum]|uniref:Uncharacterized protein n=1 Tax=Aquiflexum gelatinilyticum TaxID=2961943 RepID=A0A9X2P7G7_9BACT|nr:hypothetical protein [Aquiflexum gelatinilyticum]MCR9015718.1 hypothetical protein [Aquiflexum gelatinilyticum]
MDTYLADPYSPMEIRSTDLHDLIIKDPELAQVFEYPRDFGRFLRKQHDDGVLQQIIPNCSVDTTNKSSYQWHFRKAFRDQEGNKGIQSQNIVSKYKYYSKSKNITTSSGEKVRSKQEKIIYERLLQCDFLTIFYDHPVTKWDETKYVDFYIKNEMTRKTYIWEHFGMTNSEPYINGIPKKIDWFEYNGFKENLIITIYVSDKQFIREIEKNIDIIKM